MTEIELTHEAYVYKPSFLEKLEGEIENRGVEASSRKRKKYVKNSGSFHYLPKEMHNEIFSYIGWGGQDALHYALASRQYYQIAMSHPFMRMGHAISWLKNSREYRATQKICFEGVLVPKHCVLEKSEIDKLHHIDSQGVGFNRLLHSATDFTGLAPVLRELFKSLRWDPELTMNCARDQAVKRHAQTVHALFTKFFGMTTLDEGIFNDFDWHEVPKRAIDYQNAVSYRDLLMEKTPPHFKGMEANEAYFQFALESNGLLLEKAGEAIRDNKELVMKAVKQNGKALQFASDRLRNDRDVVLAAIRHDGLAIQHASYLLRSDKEIVKEASIKHPVAFYFADHAIHEDVDFVLELLKYRAAVFNILAPQLREDRSFISQALNINGLVLAYLSESDRKNRTIVLAAVRQNGLALEYADDDLKADPEIVEAALNQNALAAEYMDERFESIQKVALFAVTKKGMALEFFEPFQDVETVVIKALEQDGLALEHVSDRLRATFSIVYRAVLKNGLALKHVEEVGDHEMFIVTKAAVKQNGLALEFAPVELQDNEEIVKWAIIQNPQAFKFASKRLRQRGDLALMAALHLQV